MDNVKKDEIAILSDGGALDDIIDGTTPIIKLDDLSEITDSEIEVVSDELADAVTPTPIKVAEAIIPDDEELKKSADERKKGNDDFEIDVEPPAIVEEVVDGKKGIMDGIRHFLFEAQV